MKAAQLQHATQATSRHGRERRLDAYRGTLIFFDKKVQKYGIEWWCPHNHMYIDLAQTCARRELQRRRHAEAC